MPPRKRTKGENRGLPQRWEWHGGKIYYQIPPALAGHVAFDGRKRRILLGATLTEAHRRWASIQEHFDLPLTSGRLPDVALAYQQQDLPALAPKTQSDYRAAIARLSAAFQEFTIHQIEPHHCYAYVDANESRIRQARYDVRVLSSILTWCVSKGLMAANPLIGQLKFKNRRHNPPKRRHYVSDKDLAIFMTVLPRKWQLYVLLKLKTGQSQQTLLTTQWHHITEEGIDFQRTKTGKYIPMEWDDELRGIIAEIRRLPRSIGSMYLFSTRSGACYYNSEKGVASGFQSVWQRAQARAMEAGMTTRFSEHQLRHKAASDNPLAAASAALGHADERITRDVYQVRPSRVKPLGISAVRGTKKQ